MGQILYAQAAGNASVIGWNTAANGSGDSAPWGDHNEDDTLEANGNMVELDVASFVRALLQNTTGGFTINLATVIREFVCDVQAIATGGCITVVGNTYAFRMIGDVRTSDTTINSRGILAGSGAGAAAIHVEGSVFGGAASSGYGAYSTGGASFTITGRCVGGTAGNNVLGLYHYGGGTSFINDCENGSHFASPGAAVRPEGGGTLIVRGDLIWNNTTGAPVAGPFKWQPQPGKGVVCYGQPPILPTQATGILGVGV